jgi:hypothetical protein
VGFDEHFDEAVLAGCQSSLCPSTYDRIIIGFTQDDRESLGLAGGTPWLGRGGLILGAFQCDSQLFIRTDGGRVGNSMKLPPFELRAISAGWPIRPLE